MSNKRDLTSVTRRKYLTTIGATTAGSSLLAGCTGTGGQGGGQSTQTQTEGGGGATTTTQQGAASGDQTALTIQHWWTSGGSAKAIDAILKRFDEKHPKFTYKENPVAGGAGQNLHTVIKKKVLNGNPPSTWQDWPGANLQPYVKADVLQEIRESVWTKNNMMDAYLKGPKKAAKPGGNFVCVPLNIHRINNLFYNVNVVQEAGVDPATLTTPRDLISAMKKVEKNTDAAGMANQTSSPWSTLQMWAGVLLGQAGHGTYRTFTDGDASSVKSEIEAALQTIKDYSQYYTDDAGSINIVKATNKVVNGKAAFYHQGDWVAGTFETVDEFKYGKDWDQIAFPGTKGMYQLNMDSFPFPKNNPTPDATIEWLRFVGTAEAQRIFNPLKGSIPPRTDVSKDPFPKFLQEQMSEFKNSNSQPVSITHGLAVPPSQLVACKDAIESFLSSYNTSKGASSLIKAVTE